MTCDCAQAGLECGVRFYVGEPGKGHWECLKEWDRRQALITEYYRDKSRPGQPQPHS